MLQGGRLNVTAAKINSFSELLYLELGWRDRVDSADSANQTSEAGRFFILRLPASAQLKSKS